MNSSELNYGKILYLIFLYLALFQASKYYQLLPFFIRQKSKYFCWAKNEFIYEKMFSFIVALKRIIINNKISRQKIDHEGYNTVCIKIIQILIIVLVPLLIYPFYGIFGKSIYHHIFINSSFQVRKKIKSRYSHEIYMSIESLKRQMKFINPIIYKIKSIVKLMMQIQRQAYTTTLSSYLNDHKISSSVGTDTTDSAFKKKVSLCSCSSSVSLEQDLQTTKQKQMFGRYLFSTEKKETLQLEEQMKEMFSSYQWEKICSQPGFVDLSKDLFDQKGRMMSFFINLWLRHMGYGTQKNQRYLLGRIRLFLGSKALSSFTDLYNNFTLIPLDQTQKRKFLLETCRMGWEHFIQEVVKRGLVQICNPLPSPPSTHKKTSTHSQ